MSRENKFLEREHAITRETIAEFKQTDRRTEIARLTRRRWLIASLWGVSTYAVFMYYWVFLLSGETTALMASIIPGVIGGLYFFNERRIINPKILRLMKYELLFADFFEAMITDMEKNDTEKGDSWLTMDLRELRRLQNQKWGELQSPGSKKSVSAHYEHQPKLANYCAMTYLRTMDYNREEYEIKKRRGPR